MSLDDKTTTLDDQQTHMGVFILKFSPYRTSQRHICQNVIKI